jgi:polysaccharide chain length determinant protein (PEP-CTERM system associated)
MLKRRKWIILLPIVTMAAAVGYVVYKLPSVYESTTILTVKPPTIPNTVVQPLSSTDLIQRIETINQAVLSRTALEPMISKYKLFELERNAGVPTELMIEKMRKNIKVDLEKTDNEKLAAFRITYRDRAPESARNVAAELASKYINAMMIDQQREADNTQEFIDSEVELKKKTLDELSKQRLDIMMENVETLPESAQGLIAQLEGLRKSEENLSKDIQSLNSEKGRLNDNIRSLNSQIRLVEDLGQKDIEDALRKGTDVKQSPAYAQLLQKRAELEARLKNLKKQYTDKMPLVVDMREQIVAVNKALDELEASAKVSVESAKVSSDRKAEMQKRSFEIEKQKIEGQLSNIDTQISLKQQQIQQNSGQIAVLEAKINTIPNVKVALEGVETQFQTAKKAFDDLLEKKNNAQLIVNRASKAQGETIEVIDPANLPKSPVAPKRELLTAFGGALGLALGLFLAALFEIPRLFKIQNIEDAKHYTGLPLLASVPPLLTHNEIAWQKRSHWLKVLAGIAVAIGLVPLIIMALQATRVFERVVS